MGLIIIGGDGNAYYANVDSDHHFQTNPRPPAYGTLGYYRSANVSGAITATLGAASNLWTLRGTNASNLCIVQNVQMIAYVASTITTSVAFIAELFIARSYTANATGGTSYVPASGQQKMKTSMGNSLMGDLQICGTSGLSAGTWTLDNQPIGYAEGNSGTTTGTVFFGNGNNGVLYKQDTTNTYPIVLAQNEGLVIQNVLAGPATGTFTIGVAVEWGEVATY